MSAVFTSSFGEQAMKRQIKTYSQLECVCGMSA